MNIEIRNNKTSANVVLTPISIQRATIGRINMYNPKTLILFIINAAILNKKRNKDN